MRKNLIMKIIFAHEDDSKKTVTIHNPKGSIEREDLDAMLQRFIAVGILRDDHGKLEHVINILRIEHRISNEI